MIGLAAATWGLVALASPPAAKVSPPPPPPMGLVLATPSASESSELPPGWTYGVRLTPNGDRLLVPLPPGASLPPPTSSPDPYLEVKGELKMLSTALAAYYASAATGHNEYPVTHSLEELVSILKEQSLLPQAWKLTGKVVQFETKPYCYRIEVAIEGKTTEIASPPLSNPYSNLLVLPHQP